jgi:hypothetical protein
VGDYVVRLGRTSGAPGEAIVFEAKMKGGYNLRAVQEELDAAKRNRGASQGIFVFCKGYEPAEVGDFFRLGSDFIVTVDRERIEAGGEILFLEAAYKVSRALVTTRVGGERSAEIDPGYLRREIDHIEASLKLASDVSTKLATIRNSSDRIEETLRRMLDSLDEHLGNIKGHLPA